MTRRRDRPADPREELLAAHVTGGLDAEEVAEVEALLAESPAARDEADAIARLLAEVRAAEPRPADEPDWSSMTRAIQRACADDAGVAADQPGRPGPADPRRSWRRVTARPAIRWPAAVVGAAAAAAALLLLTRPPSTSAPTAATAARAEDGGGLDGPTPGRPAAGERSSIERPRADEGDPADEEASNDRADLGHRIEDELGFDPLAEPGGATDDGDELAELERALGADAARADAFIADLLADPAEQDADRRAAAEAGPERALDDDPLDPFRAADPAALDRLADELDDKDLEALDRFLAEVHAG